MTKGLMKCPECGAEFELSQAVSHDMEVEVAKKYEKQLKDMHAKSQKELEAKNRELEVAKKDAIEEAKRKAAENVKLEMKDLQEQLREKDNRIAESQKQELELRKKERELESKEKAIEVETARKMEEEKEKIQLETTKVLEEKHRLKDAEKDKKLADMNKQIDEAKRKVSETVKLEMEDLKEQLKERDDRIAESQKQELELRKKHRELESKEKELELEMVRKVDEERAKIQEETLKNHEENHRLKDAEKDKQLTDMCKQIDDLKRKAEQGSQKMQGEVLELELEGMLKEEFPFDEIEPVSSGVKGADVIQTVKTQSGKICGKILWETKRTKTWSDKWLQKLKDDQRDAKADVAVIVSEVLPSGITHFRQIEGIWVASISSANSLAVALRVVLIKVAREKRLQEGKSEKMELVYSYLTGPEFRNRVEVIVESFVGMKVDLDKEKRAMNKIWDKREKQIERVVLNIGGMQGDIEGLAGMSLPKIETLELASLEEEKTEDFEEKNDE